MARSGPGPLPAPGRAKQGWQRRALRRPDPLASCACPPPASWALASGVRRGFQRLRRLRTCPARA